MSRQSTYHKDLWVARRCFRVGCAETRSLVAGRWERQGERPTDDIGDLLDGIEDAPVDIEDPPEDVEEMGLLITHRH